MAAFHCSALNEDAAGTSNLQPSHPVLPAPSKSYEYSGDNHSIAASDVAQQSDKELVSVELLSPPSHVRIEAMDHYIRKRMRAVAGWLAPESAEAIVALCDAQDEEGIRGGVAEIGIHHGKLFLLLYLSLHDNERAVAIDIFDDQHLNQDASGAGNKAIFLKHLARVGGDEERVQIIQKDSTAVRPGEIVSAAGSIRFMSVDGGHTQAITFADIGLAEAVLADGGILVLDDVYNARWPAVAAGAFEYLANVNTALRPFAVTPNKTFFCKGDQTTADLYRDTLARACATHIEGYAEIFGSPCIIVGRRNLTNFVKSTRIVRGNASLYRALSRVRNSRS